MLSSLSDAAKARIRTLWPYLIGAVAAWLVAHIPALHIDSVTAAVVVGWVLGTAVYEGGKWLTGRTGTTTGAKTARVVGRWLLSLGLPIPAATYPTPAPATPSQPAPKA
ncbi:MAG: hypothetical protein J2P15_12505 [Micromonosporaceae bacterium]|nr:hypothetical protein [Micromonosporaceae bacterium]